MKMQTLECPKCHASLENDDENLGIFFCKYCGQKIVVEELQDVAVKVKVREMELEHEEKKMEFEQQRQNISYIQEKEKSAIDNKRRTITMIVCLAVCFAMMLPSFFYFGNSRRKHEKRVEELQKIEIEVQAAIQKKDYDLALMKANQLRLDDGYSNDATEAWNEKREDYIRLIESKQR